MSYIESAIKEAVEKGGWIPQGMDGIMPIMRTPKNILANFYHQPTIFLDPLFWQALGKARGWSDFTEEHYTDRRDRTYSRTHPTWNLNWHRFIDHLAEGKSAESFFKTL